MAKKPKSEPTLSAITEWNAMRDMMKHRGWEFYAKRVSKVGDDLMAKLLDPNDNNEKLHKNAMGTVSEIINIPNVVREMAEAEKKEIDESPTEKEIL